MSGRWLPLVLAALVLGGAAAGGSPAPNEPPPTAAALAAHVRDLIDEDRPEEALEEARRIVAARPDDPVLRSALGEALFRAGRLEEVAPVLEPLAARDDAPARGLIVLARLRAAEGRSVEATRLADRAVERAPDDPRVLFWASEQASTRDERARRLEAYLERSEGEDPDRIESARGALRTLEGLGDTRVWVPTSDPERVVLPLDRVRSSNGNLQGFSIPIVLGDRDRPIHVLLDSGASGLYVESRAARKRGFTPLSEETHFGGGGSQRHASSMGLFSTFAAGELSFENALATRMKPGTVRLARCDGILGPSVFDGYRITLDLREHRLVLDREEAAAGAPYWIVSGQILVRVDTGAEHSGLFLFDTGSRATLLSRAFAAGIPDADLQGSAGVTGFGGQRNASAVHGVSVSFSGHTVRGPFLAIDLSLRSRLAALEVSGYLGLDVLDRERIVLDTRARTVRVED